MVALTVIPEANPDASASRWIGVGRASADGEPGPDQPGPTSMGSRALRAALAGRTPALVVVFASSELDLGALMGDLRRAVDENVPVVGCTTAGEIHTDG